MTRIPRPSPSMAIALVALFVALGGVGYAASVPRNGVGPAQLKRNAVTATKLAAGAVTARALRVGSVTGADIGRGSVGPKALRDGSVSTEKLADRSVTAGKLNVPLTSVARYSAVVPAGASAFRLVRATCPANTHVTGGGGGWVGPTTTGPIETDAVTNGSRPYPPDAANSRQTQWEVYGKTTGTGERRLMAVAICAPN